jgi:O-antigen ligase
MRSLFSEARVQQLSLAWGMLIIVGIFLSDAIRVLPSIGIAGLFLTGVLYSLQERRIAQRAHWPELLSFVLVYLLHAATGLWRSNIHDPLVQQDLVLELPFVLLPVSFLLLPTWQAAHKRALWAVLIGCCLVAAVAATKNYLLHTEAINRTYLESRVMPTALDHIRFSLLVSMAVLAGTLLAFSRNLSAGQRALAALGAGLLFLFQHLLSARSGLVTMYAGGLVWLVWLGWQLRRWKEVLWTIGVLVVLVGASLLSFTTLRNKIVDTITDFNKVKTENAANYYSVTARVYSYEVAWDIIREHPVAGVSKAKLDETVATHYAARFPQIEHAHYLLPHNQFLYNAAAYGTVGLVIFLIGFYYPLWVGLRRRNILQILVYLIVSVSFLVEYTLETQVGVLTGLFFILLAQAPGPPATVFASQR